MTGDMTGLCHTVPTEKVQQSETHKIYRHISVEMRHNVLC